jgi:transposase-like protein
MPELKMTKACPACDSTNFRYRKKTIDYRCADCHAIFEELIIRPAYYQPRSDHTFDPYEDMHGLSCSNCGSTRTELLSGRFRSPRWRCNACLMVFTPKKPHPDPGILFACPICDSSNVYFTNGRWRCQSCNIVFEQPVQRAKKTRIRNTESAYRPLPKFLVRHKTRIEKLNGHEKFGGISNAR